MTNETAEESVITFAYVPQLGPGPGTLMPRTGGQPGVKYVQVCTHHLIKARREGWGEVVGAEPYVIEGPDGGHAEVMLLCKGTPIRNASPDAGARVCKIDREIYVLTGHEDPDGETETVEAARNPDKVKVPAKSPSEGIQARQPSV